MLKHLANALTLLRLVLAPVVAWALWQALVLNGDGAQADSDAWALAAAGLFILAALTDLFDGMAARAFNGESKFGRIIDPIADKLLVGLPLIVIAGCFVRTGWDTGDLLIAIPVAVIVLRDTAMTVIRLAAPDGEGARVSTLAKWKTTLELLVVGSAVLAAAAAPLSKLLGAGDRFTPSPLMFATWIGALILAALLSAWTGAQYLRALKAPAAQSP